MGYIVIVIKRLNEDNLKKMVVLINIKSSNNTEFKA